MPGSKTLTTQCLIAGGGPAGMMLGFLLARGGIEVIVLEKHGDFFRDFRGDTIHPSTFEIMYEAGILDEFLKVPHQEIQDFTAVFNNRSITIADFHHMKAAKPALGLMPQWDFLKFVEQQASRYAGFHLTMNAEVTDLIRTQDRVTGLQLQSPQGQQEIRASIVVAADGRHSIIREKAKLKVIKAGVPIDVLWLRVPREASDPGQILGRFMYGKIMVMLNRNDYWQCAFVIKKGGYEETKQKGLDAFKKDLERIAPFLSGRLDVLKSWEDIKLLSVDIDHLERWYTDGLLCIGDAAHAMSPIGGVGINLAIQDAVATANILYPELKDNKIIGADTLRRVQARRTFPTKVIQRLQMMIQNNVMAKKIIDKEDMSPPLFMRVINRFPVLRRVPAWFVGIGVRPEHVKTPDAGSTGSKSIP